MKAALLTSPRLFELREIDPPQPAKGDVLVRVTRAGICGSDLHFYATGRIGDVVLKKPFVMGHEFCGVVEDTCGVESAPPVGTRVAVEPAIPCGTCEFCLSERENICPEVKFTGFPPYSGAFAELIAIPAENLYPLPDTISDDLGPLLETLAVAIHGVDLIPDVKGKTCVVLGAGPVGLLTMMEIKRRGGNVLFMTEPVPERRYLAEELGCKDVIHPDNKSVIQSHLKRSAPYGPDMVFECVGEPETIQQAFDLPRPGGLSCIYGIYPGGSFPIDFSNARRKEQTSIFVRRSLPRDYPEAIRLVSESLLDIAPIVTHTFPLAQIDEAFEVVSQYKRGAVKVNLAV